EDGGTPIDRLMATWGRATDIEYVYSVELDDAGKLLGEEFQGKDHKLLPFRGPHEGTHPLEWVVTDNNMVGDQGDTTRRYALAPEPFDLTDVSREAVMDAHPWTYRVSAQEARREGRVAEDARPGAPRLRAHTRLPREGEPPLPPGTGRARLTRINKLFLLGEDDEPAENLFAWAGKAALVAEGPPLELALARTPR